MPDIRPITAEDALTIQEEQEKYARFIGIDLTKPPRELVQYIDGVIGVATQIDYEREMSDDMLFAFTFMLNEQYVRQFDWHWAEVNREDDGDDDNYFFAVVSPDESLAFMGGWSIGHILDGETQNAILATFDMVAANAAPAASPKQMLFID